MKRVIDRLPDLASAVATVIASSPATGMTAADADPYEIGRAHV